MSKRFGAPQGAKFENSFTVTRDDQGKWVGTDSFTCKYEEVLKLIPARGAPCPRTGWQWLQINGVKINEQHGGLVRVELTYGGFPDGEQNFGYNQPEENLVKEMAKTTSMEPLETHPRYKNVSQADKEVVTDAFAGKCARKNKGDKNSPEYWMFVYNDATETKPATEITITDPYARELANFMLRGFTEYFNPEQNYRVSYVDKHKPKASETAKVGKIDTPRGADTPDKHNWLYMGATVTQKGKVFEVTKEWKLSDEKGWEPAIYSENPPAPNV